MAAPQAEARFAEGVEATEEQRRTVEFLARSYPALLDGINTHLRELDLDDILSPKLRVVSIKFAEDDDDDICCICCPNDTYCCNQKGCAGCC